MHTDSHVEPVVGLFALRTFRVSIEGHLLPVGCTDTSWITGSCIAECGRNHLAPADDCTCGIYSLQNLNELRVQYASARRVVAVVALEGQVIQGVKGTRAQAARVIDLWLNAGPRGLPLEQRDLLRQNLPDVRFHTDLQQMLSRYPNLVPSRTPRRDLLHAAAGRWWAELTHTRPTVRGGATWALAAAVFAAALLMLGSWTGASSARAAGELTLSVLLAFTWFVLAELPALVGGLLYAGACPPTFLTPRRPVRWLWRAGSALLTGGVLAAVVTGQHVPVGGIAASVAIALVAVNIERFMHAMTPGNGRTRMLVVARGASRPRSVSKSPFERLPLGRGRLGRHGVVPVILTSPPPTTEQGA